ncbi:MAG: MBL fold metallo-hydrolase [Bacteroidia bacterium]
MFIKQLYTSCLAQAAYYVESDGEAMVIDPLRESEPYLELAKSRNAKIKYVFETHFHADFVSGHQELSRRSGAVIVYGPNAKPAYQALIAFDGETFQLGKVKIKVIHTPGHTIESSCFLLVDEKGKPYCLFSGDTLFVGDVGRPDLLSGNYTKEELAGMLYDSLNNKIKKLPDDVIVYPGHGAGSACGKNLGKETISTIGKQKKENYALQPLLKDEFIQAVISDLTSPPPYFFKDASINKNGCDEYSMIFKKEKHPLSVFRFEEEVVKGALIIDTRNAEEFGKGYIPGSINIGLNGDFAVWVGTLIEFNKPMVIVAAHGFEEESIRRLARVGYDNVLGYLRDGIEAWQVAGLELESVTSIKYQELDIYTSGKKFTIIDVRKTGENEKLSIKGTTKIPLDQLEKNISSFDKNANYLVYCAGGYRSMIAISILRKHGIKNVINLEGGINAYSDQILANH